MKWMTIARNKWFSRIDGALRLRHKIQNRRFFTAKHRAKSNIMISHNLPITNKLRKHFCYHNTKYLKRCLSEVNVTGALSFHETVCVKLFKIPLLTWVIVNWNNIFDVPIQLEEHGYVQLLFHLHSKSETYRRRFSTAAAVTVVHGVN